MEREKINQPIGRSRKRKLIQVQHLFLVKIESQRMQRKQFAPCHFALTRVLNSATYKIVMFFYRVVHTCQSVKDFPAVHLKEIELLFA